MTRMILLAALLWAPSVQAQQAGLSIAGEMVAGGQVSVTWTGPDGQSDGIGVAEPGAAGNLWVAGSWTYTSAGNPVSLALPATAGPYEIRYVTGASEVLAAAEITVEAATPATGSVAAPSGTPAALPRVALHSMLAPEGAMLSVALGADAPRDAGDFIAIAPVGAGPQETGAGLAPVPVAGPVAIDAPATAGDYELRYVVTRDGQYIPVGRAALTIVGPGYKRP